MYLNSWPDRSSGKLSRTRTHFRLIEIWIEPPTFFLFQQVSSTHKHYVAMWMFFKYRHSWSWDSDHMVSMDWILMTLQWMDSYWSTSPKNCPRDPDSTSKLHYYNLTSNSKGHSNSFSHHQEMDRLDQRCHTEAIELRAQLSAAQARFKATKVERERLRKAARWKGGFFQPLAVGWKVEGGKVGRLVPFRM